MIGRKTTRKSNTERSRNFHSRPIHHTYMPRLAMSVLITNLLCITTLQAAPTTPAGVRIDVYSDTALEVFWSRAQTNAAVSGYELNKNGNRVWLGDVTSYFDSELYPGSTNNYAVVAVDENGNRSDSSRVVTISMSGGQSGSCAGGNSCTSVSFSESQATDGADSDATGAVNGASMSIYSSSAAELFWQQNSEVSTYDIYRDDVYLKRTDGRSYYDDERMRGHDHKYKIVAIGIGGNQLGAVLISNDGVVNEVSSSFEVSEGGSSNESSNSSSGSGSSTSSSSSSANSGTASSNQVDRQVSGGISANVYSSTAGEIFWESDPVGLVKFDIYRNGTWLATTQGRSFYDDELVRDSQYSYSVYIVQDGVSKLLGRATMSTGG